MNIIYNSIVACFRFIFHLKLAANALLVQRIHICICVVCGVLGSVVRAAVRVQEVRRSGVSAEPLTRQLHRSRRCDGLRASLRANSRLRRVRLPALDGLLRPQKGCRARNSQSGADEHRRLSLLLSSMFQQLLVHY